jgi:hypothetical protein
MAPAGAPEDRYRVAESDPNPPARSSSALRERKRPADFEDAGLSP